MSEPSIKVVVFLAASADLLIEGSLKAVEEGNEFSNATQQSLLQVVQHTEQVSRKSWC